MTTVNNYTSPLVAFTHCIHRVGDKMIHTLHTSQSLLTSLAMKHCVVIPIF